MAMPKLAPQEWTILFIYGVLCYFPIFLHLDGYPAFNWDESMYGLRMLFLAEHGYPLPRFSAFEGVKPILNYKPPFLSAIQAGLLLLFGYQNAELSLRLPVALSVVGILIWLLVLSRKLTEQYSLGILAGLMLLTSGGFMAFHVARTGDHDAPLAFFSTTAWISFFFFIREKKKKARTRWLILFVATLYLGFLTKTIAIGFFLPGFLIYLLLRKHFISVFKNRNVWWAIGATIVLIGLYYGLMNLLVPDFYALERGQVDRFTRTIDGHYRAPFYYFTRLYTESFWPWLLFVPFSLWGVFGTQRKDLDELSLLAFICVLSQFVLLSFSATKLPWYDASCIPLLAWMAAYGMWTIWGWIQQLLSNRSPKLRSALAFLLIAALFSYPYQNTVGKFYHFLNWDPTEHFALMLKATHENPKFQQVSAYVHFNCPHVVFYKNIYRKQGREVILRHQLNQIQPDELVMVSQLDRIDSLEAAFQTQLLLQTESCRLYKVLAQKQK